MSEKFEIILVIIAEILFNIGALIGFISVVIQIKNPLLIFPTIIVYIILVVLGSGTSILLREVIRGKYHYKQINNNKVEIENGL